MDGSFICNYLDNKSCYCADYLDQAMCKHLVAACFKFNLFLPGLDFMPQRFRIRLNRRKYRHVEIKKSK